MKLCPGCGARIQGDGWNCAHCGYEPPTVGGFPSLAPGLAQGASGYDPEHYTTLACLEAANFWFRARNRLITWAIARYFPDAKSLLEVGCGTGYVLAGIAHAFPAMRLEASEAASAGLGYAAARVPGASFVQLDARRIPFRDEFDIVGAFDVVEHIEEDRGVLAELRKATNPGGGVILTVPQHPFLWSEQDVRAGHVRRYRARELRAKVVEAGLDVIRMSSFVTLLLPAMIWSRRMRGSSRVDFDPFAELRVPPWLNWPLERALAVERLIITLGVSLPAGGSLLLVARRPQ